jgi:hypothetical protein
MIRTLLNAVFVGMLLAIRGLLGIVHSLDALVKVMLGRCALL